MKLYAKITPAENYQHNPYEYCDFENAVENNEFVIIGTPKCTPDYRSPVWNELDEMTMPYVSEFLCDILNGDGECAYRNETDLFRHYFPNAGMDAETVERLKELTFAYDESGLNDETACELMGYVTGTKWTYERIFGACQGDFATVYYPDIPNETERIRFTDMISAYYFGTGAEVEVHDTDIEPNSPEDIEGFFDYIPIPYANGTEMKEWLLREYGTNDMTPDDIVLYTPTNVRMVMQWDYERA